ncbi:pilus assembly protein TadG-related protein [Thalassovita taeanensis]|nr:pilus assembly protein TadG-related protein [Thalassovita taeanensis]
MVAFSLFLFLMMVLAGGVGIDLMRYERDRTKLQNTLDRAVLAAADLDQTLPAKAVVEDYFDKAGIGQYLTDVTVDEGVGFRSVSATAESTLKTFFLKLSGISTLSAAAAGTAEERIDGVEISLVLDVSGSMSSNSRLARLKPAARDFVDTVMAASEDGKVSVSVVPYATQVSAGKALLSKFNVTQEHDYSYCINFNGDDFSSASMSRVALFERTAHFDPFTYSEGELGMPVCPVGANKEILPLSRSANTLHGFINGLEAGGNTSIDIGMKWGLTLLDPGTQSVVTELTSEGEIDAAFSGRPVNYTDGTTLKVIVLMTDGQNTDQYMLNPSLRDGDSDVYYNEEAQRYSVANNSGTHDNSTTYFWPSPLDGQWHDHPYGNGTHEECTTSYSGGYYYYGGGKNKGTTTCSTVDEPGASVRLEFPQLWNRISLASNANDNYYFNNNAWAEWYNAAFTKKESAAKNQQTKHICNQAKDNGVIIFAIGFEAPNNGRKLLKDCASSDSHYFDASGLEINDAFESIAASIRKLRLTQ